MDLEGEGMDWTYLAPNRCRWRARVNAVMKFDFRKMQGISCLAKELLASEEGLCCMELVRRSVLLSSVF
jgi:hypothetical protein